MHDFVDHVVDAGSKALADSSLAYTEAWYRPSSKMENGSENGSIGRAVADSGLSTKSERNRSVNAGVAGLGLPVDDGFVTTGTDELGEFCRLIVV